MEQTRVACVGSFNPDHPAASRLIKVHRTRYSQMIRRRRLPTGGPPVVLQLFLSVKGRAHKSHNLAAPGSPQGFDALGAHLGTVTSRGWAKTKGPKHERCWHFWIYLGNFQDLSLSLSPSIAIFRMLHWTLLATLEQCHIGAPFVRKPKSRERNVQERVAIGTWKDIEREKQQKSTHTSDWQIDRDLHRWKQTNQNKLWRVKVSRCRMHITYMTYNKKKVMRDPWLDGRSFWPQALLA